MGITMFTEQGGNPDHLCERFTCVLWEFESDNKNVIILRPLLLVSEMSTAVMYIMSKLATMKNLSVIGHMLISYFLFVVGHRTHI
jgi:hypothetical protein